MKKFCRLYILVCPIYFSILCISKNILYPTFYILSISSQYVLIFLTNLQVFPVFYVLMSKKTALCYKAVFQYIESNVFHLEPTEFMTDFEAGMRKSIKYVYPGTILRGCWFHYCQGIRKKSLRLGLGPLLNSCSEAKKILKEVMSLPLLPAENFLEGYSYVQRITEEFEISPDFESFFSYFESFWLVEVINNI